MPRRMLREEVREAIVNALRVLDWIDLFVLANPEEDYNYHFSREAALERLKRCMLNLAEILSDLIEERVRESPTYGIDFSSFEEGEGDLIDECGFYAYVALHPHYVIAAAWFRVGDVFPSIESFAEWAGLSEEEEERLTTEEGFLEYVDEYRRYAAEELARDFFKAVDRIAEIVKSFSR